VRSVAGDASGAVIVSGALDGAVDPDDCEAPQTGQPPNVIKFSPEGKRLWSWTLGGAAGADARVTVAPDQKVVVYGTFAEPLDFDPGPAADIRTPNQSDGFIVELDGNGRMVRPARIFDGPINLVQIGADGTWYVAGMFLDGDDIDPGPGELRPTLPVSTFGGYILALNADGQLRWVGSYPQSVTITQLAIGADGIFVTGGFPGEADLDPGPGEDRRRAVDGTIASFWGRFLGALDLDGKHKWVRTWGASSSDGLGAEQVVLLADGSLVVCGDFLGTLVVDGQRFWQNPDSSLGSVFLIAFEPMGVTRWIRAFPEEGNSASCSGGFAQAFDGTLLVAGYATGPVTVPFSGTIDTPPGVSGYVARLSLPP